jgi:glycosyltransferase involved in cell wall biosynthesis
VNTDFPAANTARAPAGTPVLSVIIPVRNHARPLKRLLDNLTRQQTPPGWIVEVIVVDNKSTDSTPAVIRESGFRGLVCERLGAGAARNAGVQAATGKLLYFIDADACPSDDRHFILLVQIARRLGAFGAFGGAVLLPKHQRWNPVAIADHWACWFNWHPKRPPQRTTLFQPGLSLAVTRTSFNAVGGFNPDIMVFQDMEFQHRLLRAGFKLFFFPKLMVTHEARGSIWRTCLHSWSWGGPFRTRYLTDVKGYKLKYPLGHKLFARNLPTLYHRRMRLVTRASWMNSKWRTFYAFPFLALTVLIWTMGVIWGPDRRPASRQFPI